MPYAVKIEERRWPKHPMSEKAASGPGLLSHTLPLAVGYALVTYYTKLQK